MISLYRNMCGSNCNVKMLCDFVLNKGLVKYKILLMPNCPNQVKLGHVPGDVQ